MKNALILACSFTLMAALTACQERSDTTAAVPSGTTKSGDMADMPAAGAMQHGVAVGTVTAIDAAKGAITLDHGPMSGVEWPAMTMEFTAEPEQLSGVKVGDRVDFEIDWDGKVGRITRISAQNPAVE